MPVPPPSPTVVVMPYREPAPVKTRRTYTRRSTWVERTVCDLIGHSWFELHHPTRHPAFCMRCSFMNGDGLTDTEFECAMHRALAWFNDACPLRDVPGPCATCDQPEEDRCDYCGRVHTASDG